MIDRRRDSELRGAGDARSATTIIHEDLTHGVEAPSRPRLVRQGNQL